MSVKADKLKEIDGNASVLTLKRNKSDKNNNFEFVDNRQETAAQRKVNQWGNNSSKMNLRAKRELINNNPQSKQFEQINLNSDQQSAIQTQSNSISFNPVTQLVRMVRISSFSGKDIDIDDPETLDDLIEMLEDELEGPAIKAEISRMPLVIAAVNERKPGALSVEKESEDSIALTERAAADSGGWIVQEPRSKAEKLQFLNTVIDRARMIIPKAFNRSIEVGKVGEDFTNNAYACKNVLVDAYAVDCRKAGIQVENKYVHPAALERLYDILRSTRPEGEAQTADITGVCKDFASITYGLILQNDISRTLNPKLAFMHGHVFVHVNIFGELFAVDAWFGGKVIPLAQHEELVSKKHSQISKAGFGGLHVGKQHQNSLEFAYENAELARLVWYQNEARYRKLAIAHWGRGKMEHVNRGSL